MEEHKAPPNWMRNSGNGAKLAVRDVEFMTNFTNKKKQ